MNGEYYTSLFKRLRACVKEKRRANLRRDVLDQDNAQVHTSHVALAALNE